MEEDVEVYGFNWWQSAGWHTLGVLTTVAYVVTLVSLISSADRSPFLMRVLWLFAFVPLSYLTVLPDLLYMRFVPRSVRFKNNRFIITGPFGKPDSIPYLRIREAYSGQYGRADQKSERSPSSRFSMGFVLDDGTCILLDPKEMIDPRAVIAAVKADNPKCLVFERPYQSFSRIRIVAFVAIPAAVLMLSGTVLLIWTQSLRREFQHWVSFGPAGKVTMSFDDETTTLTPDESAVVGRELKRSDARGIRNQPSAYGGAVVGKRLVLTVGTTKRLRILVETDANCDSLFWLKADTFLKQDYSIVRSRMLSEMICRYRPPL